MSLLRPDGIKQHKHVLFQLLQSALMADLHDARSLRGSGHKLASLQRMKDQDGRFSDSVVDSWIHTYSISRLLDWEREET